MLRLNCNGVKTMRFSDQQRVLRDQIEVVCYRFLHAESFFRIVTGRDQTYWVFSQNCFGETACLLWCHLFNSRNNDPVHYWKLFGENQLAPLSETFRYEAVKQRLLSAAGFDNESYAIYRQQVVDFRNKYVSHREYEVGSIIFPDLKRAASMVLELRVLLEETVRAELNQNPEDVKLIELVEFYDSHGNDFLLQKCSDDAKVTETPEA